MGCTAPHLSHLFFTDDYLLFIQDSPQSIQKLLLVESNYEKVSDQKINLNKPIIFFVKKKV